LILNPSAHRVREEREHAGAPETIDFRRIGEYALVMQ
jgi:hypothetical protein